MISQFSSQMLFRVKKSVSALRRLLERTHSDVLWRRWRNQRTATRMLTSQRWRQELHLWLTWSTMHNCVSSKTKSKNCSRSNTLMLKFLRHLVWRTQLGTVTRRKFLRVNCVVNWRLDPSVVVHTTWCQLRISTFKILKLTRLSWLSVIFCVSTTFQPTTNLSTLVLSVTSWCVAVTTATKWWLFW